MLTLTVHEARERSLGSKFYKIFPKTLVNIHKKPDFGGNNSNLALARVFIVLLWIPFALVTEMLFCVESYLTLPLS